jgi:phosphotransferase system  glucose/maltose/N-acetylglucosamine-specific IIC component
LVIALSSCHLVFIIVILLFNLYIDFILSILTIHEDLNTINRKEEQGD